MNIDKMMEQFSTVEEMKIFCQSQMKQIQNLAKENKELKEKLAKADKPSAPSMVAGLGNMPVAYTNLGVQDDAKTIAQVQLNLLKIASFDRELNSDEAKRVELYNRIILGDVEKDKKSKKDDASVMPAAELLKLVE